MAEPKHRLLYADLFKSTSCTGDDSKVASAISESQSWSRSSGSSSSQVSSAWDSSSASSAASDLCSSEADEEDFTGELTRQMAECMLRDDSAPRQESQVKYAKKLENNSADRSSVDSSAGDQVCEVKNQLPKSTIKDVPKKRNGGNTTERRKQPGSGMRAVFLQPPKTGVPGTGVFLPRVNRVPVEFRKKSGCSTVLIPTRVLELLELHHNRRIHSNSPLPGVAPPIAFRSKDAQHPEQKRQAEEEAEEMLQLPQEWTY